MRRIPRRLAAPAALVLSALALSPAGAAYADEDDPKPEIGYLFSARGPGEGRVLGVGGRALAVLPAFDVLYARALAEKTALDLRVSTLGLVTCLLYTSDAADEL